MGIGVGTGPPGDGIITMCGVDADDGVVLLRGRFSHGTRSFARFAADDNGRPDLLAIARSRRVSRAFAMSPTIAARAQQLPASPIRKLMPLADEAKQRGVRVIHLNIGQPDLPTPAAMRRRLLEVPEVLAYSASAGTPEFLGSLRRYYAGLGIEVGERGDPRDQRRKRSAPLRDDGLRRRRRRGARRRAVLYELHRLRDDGRRHARAPHEPRRGWLSLARRAPIGRRAVTPRTRMVILCNPNNPTGTVYTREELEMVAGFCRDRNLFLISDEVYRELAYDGRDARSARSRSPNAGRSTVVVDSLSKRYSACGIRLGCLVTRNREVHEACLRMAQGRLSRARARPARRARRGRPRSRILREIVGDVPAPPRRALPGPQAIPGVVPPQAGGRVLLHRLACRSPTARTSVGSFSRTSPSTARR